MKKNPKIILASALVVFLTILAFRNEQREEQKKIIYNTSGPESGSLVIVGGGIKDTSVINTFIKLAGGVDAPMVIIPTASGEKEFNNREVSKILTSAGARKVSVLHTYDKNIANTEAFVKPLKNARGVWFDGGRQWRLVDAYANTLTEKEIRNVLTRGGVIGGSSAGATIQGSFLVRGDTKSNMIMMGDHIQGFSYLKNSAIDQHILVRNRQNDLPQVISRYPNLLGIGLDENTAIVVKGDEFEVIGQSYVALYDYNLWSENPAATRKLQIGAKFFLLRKVDRYNIKKREVTRWSGDSARNIFSDSTSVSKDIRK